MRAGVGVVRRFFDGVVGKRFAVFLRVVGDIPAGDIVIVVDIGIIIHVFGDIVFIGILVRVVILFCLREYIAPNEGSIHDARFGERRGGGFAQRVAAEDFDQPLFAVGIR